MQVACSAKGVRRPIKRTQPIDSRPDLKALRSRLITDWNNLVPGIEPCTRYDMWDKCESTKNPPMRLENVCYESPVFRKMHIEYGEIGDEFRVLHCVLSPKIVYPVPIFGADIIQRGSKTTFCITDVSPVTKDLMLPTEYLVPLQHLKRNLIRTASLRQMPAWGRDIFSEACLCLSPKSNECVHRWFRYTLSAHKFYLDAAAQTPRQWDFVEIYDAHLAYAEAQRKNEKTRAILEYHFGKNFADLYMNQVLFDVPTLENSIDGS